MKQTRTLLNWLTVCGLAMATVASATAETAKQRAAEVVRIKGSARYTTGNNVWQPLKIGTILGAGAIIQTASGSTVDIVLSETTGVARLVGTSASAGAGKASMPSSSVSYNPTVQPDVVRLQPDTVLAIDKIASSSTGADTVTDTQLDLRSGRIVGSVHKISAASTFEIKIPNGVAGIRGTWFSISAAGVISVWDGSVAIAVNTPGGTKVIAVETGFQYDVTTGKLTPIPANQEREGKFQYSPNPRVYLQVQPSIYVSPTAGS